MANSFLVRLVAGALAIMSASPLLAEPLPAPTGPVILTVTGQITETNVAGSAQFDAAMLADLGMVEFATATNWTEGVNSFSGPALAAVLTRVGAAGSTLRAVAINDYLVEFPLAEAFHDGPTLAFLMNGAEMSVRDKGPIWLIFPFDSNIEFRTEEIYRRSVWQLDRLEVLP